MQINTMGGNHDGTHSVRASVFVKKGGTKVSKPEISKMNCRPPISISNCEKEPNPTNRSNALHADTKTRKSASLACSQAFFIHAVPPCKLDDIRMHLDIIRSLDIIGGISSELQSWNLLSNHSFGFLQPPRPPPLQVVALYTPLEAHGSNKYVVSVAVESGLRTRFSQDTWYVREKPEEYMNDIRLYATRTLAYASVEFAMITESAIAATDRDYEAQKQTKLHIGSTNLGKATDNDTLHVVAKRVKPPTIPMPSKADTPTPSHALQRPVSGMIFGLLIM
ncbi:uncharacterized protein BDR25DRAFT_362006 [Lindgomyces ingoldianus]|uniref:Uncharacterized protein n=1 Tax=Lindgomyces ingoldianus TaxID=673940 RepID=A0ACB6QAV0_9PLEO|nr:uncharacterized protein BDR25DRAFT_362006 [Lindgomyces ingoldianus]KAF2464083.1 hypothetical protein BDR25DRAFT_362006 [Lindgomyces ingoldianus]